MTRTTRPGYIRDLRRLTVALSRARLGLYILGRKAVFEAIHELHAAFKLLFERSDELQLVTGEMHGAVSRTVDDEEVERTAMVGVEHLGQYVFEMTKVKIEALKEGREVLPVVREEDIVKDGQDDEDEDEDESSSSSDSSSDEED